MLCDIQEPVLSATRIRARIVLFNLEIPMTRGFTVSNTYIEISLQDTVHSDLEMNTQ